MSYLEAVRTALTNNAKSARKGPHYIEDPAQLAEAYKGVEQSLAGLDKKRSDDAINQLPLGMLKPSYEQEKGAEAANVDGIQRWKDQISSMMASDDPVLQQNALSQIAGMNNKSASIDADKKAAAAKALADREEGKVTYEEYKAMTPAGQKQYREFRGFNDRYLNLEDMFVNTSSGQVYDINHRRALVNKGVAEGDIDFMDDYMKVDVSRSMLYDDIDYTKELLTELSGETSYNTSGFAAYLNIIPTADSKKWNALKDTIVARLGLDKLKSMKQESSTGASGMGSLSEKELLVLERNLGNLEQTQDPVQIKRIIKNITKQLDRTQEMLRKDQAQARGKYNSLAPEFGKDMYDPYEYGEGKKVYSPSSPPSKPVASDYKPVDASGRKLAKGEDGIFYYVNPNDQSDYARAVK
jgi:hypothetical protein